MPEITRYSELKAYDPIAGEDTLTLIGYTGRGAYWIRGSATEPGRKRREQRAKFLARLQQAVTTGQEPGEVSLDGPAPTKERGDVTGEDRGLW